MISRIYFQKYQKQLCHFPPFGLIVTSARKRNCFTPNSFPRFINSAAFLFHFYSHSIIWIHPRLTCSHRQSKAFRTPYDCNLSAEIKKLTPVIGWNRLVIEHLGLFDFWYVIYEFEKLKLKSEIRKLNFWFYVLILLKSWILKNLP